MPALFFENYSKTYYAPYCSTSTCLCLVMIIFAIIFPFLVAYASDGKFKLFNIKINLDFWINISTYTEQPTVTYNNQFILNVLQGDESYFFSSVLKLNDYYDNILPVPLVKVKINIILDRKLRHKLRQQNRQLQNKNILCIGSNSDKQYKADAIL